MVESLLKEDNAGRWNVQRMVHRQESGVQDGNNGEPINIYEKLQYVEGLTQRIKKIVEKYNISITCYGSNILSE